MPGERCTGGEARCWEHPYIHEMSKDSDCCRKILPLESSIQEGSGECTVIPVQHQMHRGEEAECVSGILQDLIGNDAAPERVESGCGEDIISCLSFDVVVVERELGQRFSEGFPSSSREDQPLRNPRRGRGFRLG